MNFVNYCLMCQLFHCRVLWVAQEVEWQEFNCEFVLFTRLPSGQCRLTQLRIRVPHEGASKEDKGRIGAACVFKVPQQWHIA